MSVGVLALCEKNTAAFFTIKCDQNVFLNSALYAPSLIWSTLINQLIFLSQGLFINLIINKSRHSISTQILIANFVITVPFSLFFPLFFGSLYLGAWCG